MTQADKNFIDTCEEILKNGTKKAQEIAKETMSKVKESMKLNYFNK